MTDNTKRPGIAKSMSFPDVEYNQQGQKVVFHPIPHELSHSMSIVEQGQSELDAQFIDSNLGLNMLDFAVRYAARSKGYISYNVDKDIWYIFDGVKCVPAPSSFLLAVVRLVSNGLLRESKIFLDRGIKRLQAMWNVAFPDTTIPDNISFKDVLGEIEKALLDGSISKKELAKFHNNAKVVTDDISYGVDANKSAHRILDRHEPLNVLMYAAKQSEIERHTTDYDSCPSDIVVLNGTLDLTKSPKDQGFLRKSLPTDLNTMSMNVEYRPGNASPYFDNQYKRMFGNNTEQYEAFKKILGGSLDASHLNPRAIMLYGEKQAGKSTLMKAMIDIFGDYATSMPSNAFIQDKHAPGKNSPNAVLLKLFRKRFAVASEPDSGNSLDEVMLKSLTSPDVETARGLYERNFVDFNSTALIVMLVNDRPRLSGNSDALNVRLALSYCRSVPEGDRVNAEQVINSLLKDRSGILNFLIEGLELCKKDNWSFILPDVMQDTVNDYTRSHGDIEEFLESVNVRIDKDSKKLGIEATELYTMYLEWYKGKDDFRKGKIKFFEDLQARGFEKARDTKDRVNGKPTNKYRFIGIYKDDEQSTDEQSPNGHISYKCIKCGYDDYVVEDNFLVCAKCRYSTVKTAK